MSPSIAAKDSTADLVSAEVVATTSSIAARLAATAGQTDANRSFPSENIKLLGEKGLMGMLLPEQLGGLNASALAFARSVQIIGGSCASTGMVFVMHCCAVETIFRHQPGLEKLLKQAAAGKHLSTLACSERGSGANFYASSSTSGKSERGIELNGAKSFVTSGAVADSYVVSLRALGSESSINTTLYLLERDTPGMEFCGTWDGLGLRGNSSIVMNLKDCLVAEPALNQVGAQGQGFEIEMSTILPRFLLGTAAVYNGIAEAAMLAAIEHVKTRELTHTGEKLNALPVMRNKIARMKVAVAASRALMCSAAALWDESGAADLVALLEVKQMACRTAVDVATLALETCGGIAYSGALPIERHLRDAQAGVVMAPTSDMLLDLIGGAALDMPLM